MMSAMILAAGASRRMGCPKALLKIGDKTFLQHIAETLREGGVDDTVIVLGAEASAISLSLTWFGGEVVINSDWQNGQLASIVAGLEAIERRKPDAMLLCPVDHPRITPMLIMTLLHRWRETGKSIVIPTYQGRRGHPVIFSSTLFAEIKNSPAEIGARHVVWNHNKDVAEVETDDEGVVLNLDSPHDVARHSEGRLL